MSADPGGLPKQTGDFGQTMFVWGVPAGTYIISPYFGPATQRDAVGGTVDLVGDPVGWSLGVFGWKASIATGGLSATVRLGQFKEAEESSIDFYSFLRSDYYQIRRADLREALGLPPLAESPATPSPATASPQDRNRAVTMIIAVSSPDSRRGVRTDGPRCIARRTGPAVRAAAREPALKAKGRAPSPPKAP